MVSTSISCWKPLSWSVTTKQFSDLKAIMLDVFALDISELGCTSLVKHTIDAGDNPPIKQQPYRTPMIYCE